MFFEMFDSHDETTETAQCLEILADFGLPIEEENWWTRYPIRAVEEIYKLESTNASISVVGSKLTITESITNNFNKAFVISIEVQDNHPFKMPKVFLKEPQISSSDTIHMYSGRQLCLMHPDAYHSSISILEIRNLAAAWCFCYTAYQKTGSWPGAEHEH